METDPFPASFMSDIEYSVITSDVVKSFDCIAYQSIYFFHFSSSPMKISVADFSAPIKASVFKFCVHLQVG